MKKLLHMSVTLLLAGLLMLSAAATAFAGGMENECLYNYQGTNNGVPADGEWETVEKLVLLSRTGEYTFTGEDADSDGTVTMETGNTYNFVLEKSTLGSELGGTGILLKANENATYLPLDNEGTYANLYYDTPISERVEFIDISLNSKTKREGYSAEASPHFSFVGKVICTMTFEVSSVYHVGDGDITYEDEENHYTYMNEAEPLDEPILVTYTITIDGISNGVFSEPVFDDSLSVCSGVGYNSAIIDTDGEALYTIDIDIDGESTHYNLKDPEEKINWLSVCFRFDITDWSFMTVKDERYKEYEENEGHEWEEEHHAAVRHESGFLRAARSTAVALCGAALGLLGCAVSNGLAGAAGAASSAPAETGYGDDGGESTPELPEEDTEGVSVSLDVAFEELLNTKGAAVTIPISVSGGEEAKWHYLVSAVSHEAPKAVAASAAGNNAVLALTGDLNGENTAEVTLFVTAWSAKSDGKIQKASTAEELTIHTEGITAENEDGGLKVTLYTPSRVKGVAEVTELSAEDYEITDGVIRTKKEPHYTCNMPEK